MKKIKVILIVLPVLVVLGIGCYFGVSIYLNEKASVEAISITGVLEERLEDTAELNTAEYICECIGKFEDSKKFKGVKVPLTGKNITCSYKGTIKAGIKDLSQAKITQKYENIIVVQLPKVEITGQELDKKSLIVYDETKNILNQISTEDVNKVQKNLEAEMVKRAEEHGLLDTAKKNAETVISSMLKSADDSYTVEIEWED